MRFAVLGSGSSGNAYLLQEGETLVLIDAGFSLRQIRLRMAPLGLKPEQITAVLLTHEHVDHCSGLPVFLRKYPVPVHATSGSFEAMACPVPGDMGRPLESGRVFRLDGLRITPFSVSHDALDPVGFIAENGAGRRLGLASDLGTVTTLVARRLQGCHLLALEANHDEEMLRRGPYPFPVQQRIRSLHGHLSNRQLCAALPDFIHAGLRCVIPIHLSRTNNDPILVKYGVTEVLKKSAGSGVGCHLSSQNDILPFLEV